MEIYRTELTLIENSLKQKKRNDKNRVLFAVIIFKVMTKSNILF